MSYLTVMGDGCVSVHEVTKIEFAKVFRTMQAESPADMNVDESEVWEEIVVNKGYKLSQVDWMVTKNEPQIVIN
jgi:hypothetical protein